MVSPPTVTSFVLMNSDSVYKFDLGFIFGLADLTIGLADFLFALGDFCCEVSIRFRAELHGSSLFSVSN